MPKQERIMKDTMGNVVRVNTPEAQASFKRKGERKKAEQQRMQAEWETPRASESRTEDENLSPEQKRLKEIAREREVLNKKLKNPKMHAAIVDMGDQEAVAKQVQAYTKGLIDQLKYLDHEEVKLRERMEQAGS
ncbi:hypothetical protein HZC53_04215 [Candidatus Uhrbacteria bacterium]|nr:hypothetical protein [Candidatus Uhrbacteria bacterium]